MVKNLTEARLAEGYQASRQYTYEKLLDSSTMLYPYRKPYTTLRMINDAEGQVMRREWKGAEVLTKQIMNSRTGSYTRSTYLL